MSLDHIRVSERAKDQLTRLKRTTGIQNWNVLCRWAFCVSIADPSLPTLTKIPADSSVEMTWKVFGGAHDEIYLGLLKERCRRDGMGTSEDILNAQFRLHLHRGIGTLAADKRMRNIADLVRRAADPQKEVD
ncbi:DNA sulfur modification protein DndE [Acidicapsa dinghuensis]|uniref:DNA sulfur modification protein DndE n=1 Tax=Acidicapsa dinghuensis TaxID=2218256 RepID=A0ABW1ELA3_9BACT|nr:DNA sulfur modification protein DndE [Acidicapsa dinghuensis]